MKKLTSRSFLPTLPQMQAVSTSGLLKPLSVALGLALSSHSMASDSSATVINDVVPMSAAESAMMTRVSETTGEQTLDIIAFLHPDHIELFGERESRERVIQYIRNAQGTFAFNNLPGRLRLLDILPIEGIPSDAPFASIQGENGNPSVIGASGLASILILNEVDENGDLRPANLQFQRSQADNYLFVDVPFEGEDTRGIAGLAAIFGVGSSILDNVNQEPEMFHVFTHELGHNLGANHEAENVPATSETEVFARAARCSDNDERTVMYSSISPSGDIQRFSSPREINGRICGSEMEDNERAITDFLPTAMNRVAAQTIDGQVFFASSLVEVDEEAGVAQVVLSRNGDLSRETEVELVLDDGSAVLGEDFSTPLQKVLFPIGTDTVTAEFPITVDDDETNEFLTARLRFPYFMQIDESRSEMAINIVSNGVFGFAGRFEVDAPGSVSEGIGEVSINVNRLEGITGEVAITADIDLNGTTSQETLSFSNGQTTDSFTISIPDNNTDEANYSLTITLSADDDSAEVAAPFVITVTDNDSPANTGGNANSGGDSGGGSMSGLFALMLGLAGLVRRTYRTRSHH